jgi:hypothetical protein
MSTGETPWSSYEYVDSLYQNQQAGYLATIDGNNDISKFPWYSDLEQWVLLTPVTATITGSSACGSNKSLPGDELKDWYFLDAVLKITGSASISLPAGSSSNLAEIQKMTQLRKIILVITPTFAESNAFLYGEIPATYQGGATSGTSFSWNLQGSFGFFGMAGTGSVGGGVSVTKSVSEYVPDLMVKDQSAGQNPTWEYDVEYTDGAPAIATNDLTLEVAWVWNSPATARMSGTGLDFQVQITLFYSSFCSLPCTIQAGPISFAATVPYAPMPTS